MSARGRKKPSGPQRKEARRPAPQGEPAGAASASSPRPPAGASCEPDRTQDPFLALTLLIVTLLAFAPALGAEFVWDDKAITGNPVIREPGGLARIWFSPRANIQEEHYWPVVYTVLRAEWFLSGGTPFLFHLVNILLHVCNAMLLVRVARRLGVRGAWIAGFIFALHPAHVESVAWAIELKDVLSAFFYLLAALLFLGDGRARDSVFLTARTGASLLCFVLALLSKSIVISLPVILLLVRAWGAPPGRLKAAALRLSPFFVVAALIAIGDLWFVRTRPTRDAFDFGFDPVGRAATAFRILWFHAGKFLWPSRTMAIHPGWNDPLAPILAAGTISLVLGVSLLWRPAEDARRFSGLCLAHFTLTLAPVLGIIPFDFMRFAPTADRYGYLASISLCLIVGALLSGLPVRGWKRPAAGHGSRRPEGAVILALALPLAALAVQSARFTSVWKNELTLWSHNARWNPTAPMVAMNLSSALAARGETDRALEILRRSAEAHPESAELHESLGGVLAKAGDPTGAEAAYRRAVGIKPLFTAAHYGLGLVLSGANRMDEAREAFLRAAECNPDFASAHAALGNLAIMSGDAGAAAGHFRRAADLEPASVPHRLNLAEALAASGRESDAVSLLEALAEEHPNDASVRGALGAELARAGRAAEAEAHLNAAVRLNPGLSEAWNALGILAAGAGDIALASARFARAVEADPANTNARENLHRARALIESPEARAP